MDPLTAFVDAFNLNDLDAMADLLAPDASAQVLGSPFPVERGVDTIRLTSFPHIADPHTGLEASRVRVEGAEWIFLRRPGGGPLDTALRATLREGAIARIEYVVAPHRPDELRALGLAAGIATCADL